MLRGDGIAEAEAEAARLAADEGRTYVHPFDDPAVIAGQGTCALEMLADHPELDTLVVPVGGGGLLAGMAVAARHLRPGIELVGRADRALPVDGRPSCTTRRRPSAGRPSPRASPSPAPATSPGRIIEALVDDVVTVTEEHVEEGINLLLEIEKVVTEGAGAAGIAALVEHRERFAGRQVGVVLSGGNVDPRLLASVIMRGLIRNGRLSRLHIEVPDVPGSLGTVTTILGEVGANIVEILHQRMFVDLSAKSAEIEVTIETLDHHHVDRAVAALEDAGYVVRLGTFTYRDAPPAVTPGRERGRRSLVAMPPCIRASDRGDEAAGRPQRSSRSSRQARRGRLARGVEADRARARAMSRVSPSSFSTSTRTTAVRVRRRQRGPSPGPRRRGRRPGS